MERTEFTAVYLHFPYNRPPAAIAPEGIPVFDKFPRARYNDMGSCRSRISTATGYSKVIQDAIGEKKFASMGPTYAADLTNPNYRSHNPKWTKNCQRCVWAYEMLRRGYNVTALPRILDGADDLPYMDRPEGWPNVMKGGTLLSPAKRGKDTAKEIDKQMAAWGDGARAIVRVQWKNSRNGHVFIAERRNGATEFIDPQTNTFGVEHYFGQAKKMATRLMRIDNLEPTDLIAKCVKQR